MSERRRSRVTDQAVEQEIKHEQVVVDRIYTRLEAAAESARSLQKDGHARARLGNEGGLVERDAMVFQAAKRLASLNAAHEGLVFGRLDNLDKQIRYIGRLGLRDEEREVLLVDWRAPAASVFYQATAQDPAGVVRRRVLQSVADQVVGIEDDLLDAAHAGDDLVIVGEGALFASLAKSRDRTMHSVVATIQREQDDAIRSPHRGVTTIVGGPGTGKTVVALHRAAYLLYTDRRRYEGGGVLVVGPNAVFMAYIERVLPSLGETSVSLRALGEVVDGIRASRHDSAKVARVKGSARMRRILSRTARGPVPGAPTDFRIFYRDDVLTLDEAQLTRIRRDLIDRWQRRNKAAPHVAEELVNALWPTVAGDRALDRGRDRFSHTLLGERGFLDFVEAWWPVVDAVDVIGWLNDRDRLSHDAAGALTGAEVDDLVESLAADDFSVEDVPLIDELRYLIGELPEVDEDEDPVVDLHDETVPELRTAFERQWGHPTSARARPTASTQDDGYAHVLVDEAQDLSPMQWRMVGRRGRHASWTVVGDAAQSSWPLTEEASAARVESFGAKERRTFRLSTNYRNSKEVFEMAADLARAYIPMADLPVAVRETGIEPVVHEVSAPELPTQVRDAVDRLALEVGGTVGVVVAVGCCLEVDEWLAERDRERIPVLEALDTKGLEFDAIVVVQPDGIVDESAVGMRTLYVVLTRATRHLEVIGTSHRWRP